MRQAVSIALMLVLLCLASPSRLAAETTSTPDPLAARTAILRFGIDSEVLDLFRSLGSEKETRYNEEILFLFAKSTNPKLRSAILDLFKSLQWKGAEQAALALVKGRDSEDPLLVSSALAYLAEIKSKSALEYAQALLDENNKVLLPSLVTLLGKVGGSHEEEVLLAWLKGDAPTQQLRELAIRALGDIGSEKAGASLAKIVEDGAAQRFERVYAAEAIAKIGYKPGMAALIKAANGEDPTLRTAAIEALGSFEGPDSERALLEALRDSYVKCRIAACKGLGKKRLQSAIPNLEYKVTNDPDKTVKAEALRALGEIGGKEAFAFISSILDNRKGEATQRSLAFGILQRKNAVAALDDLTLILSEEAKTQDRVLYVSLVREIASGNDAPDIAALARFLMADKDYLVRLGGLEWVRVTKSPAIKATVEELAVRDANEAVRRRASEVLAMYTKP